MRLGEAKSPNQGRTLLPSRTGVVLEKSQREDSRAQKDSQDP